MCLVTDLQYLQLLLNMLFLYLDAIKCSYSKNYCSYTDAVNLICSFHIAVILGLKDVMHTSLELVQHAGNLDIFYTV